MRKEAYDDEENEEGGKRRQGGRIRRLTAKSRKHEWLTCGAVDDRKDLESG